MSENPSVAAPLRGSEIRQNKATKEWVIFAPSRRMRPHDLKIEPSSRAQLPVHDPKCPFCPGNEKGLPSIVMELPALAPRSSSLASANWQTRVVPNRYPALTPDGDTMRITRGVYLAMKGYGRHEVIIECPAHNRDIADLTVPEATAVIETYHRRYTELMKTHENMMIIIFRNHGLRAGTSLIHPHSQIIVTGVIPNHLRHREEEARRYFDEFGRCVYRDILEFELKERRRLIFENRSFIAYIPFAASVPFEIAIMPRRHSAGFGRISEAERPDLAEALTNVLARLGRKLHDPDYNYVINTSERYSANEPQLHWFLEIRPRLTTPAGFEIGSGISINPSLPEEDADFLNQEAIGRSDQ